MLLKDKSLEAAIIAKRFNYYARNTQNLYPNMCKQIVVMLVQL